MFSDNTNEEIDRKDNVALDYQKLKEIHDRIQQGELILDKYVIDEALPTWGNYITGLLRHLGCFKGR